MTHRARTLVIALLAGCACALSTGLAQAVEVVSPDGRLRLLLEVKDFAETASGPVWSVTCKGEPIITASRLGLSLADGPLQANVRLTELARDHRDAQWTPVYGERSTVRDNYKQVEVELKEQQAPHRVMRVTLRAYDTGVAFCYTLRQQAGNSSARIARELTEFRFPADRPAWATYTAQGQYAKSPISKIRSGCERPLVVQLSDNLYVALAEARLVDYARMKFGPIGSGAPGLVSELSGSVDAALPLTTPWRVVMVAESPGALLENNDLILNLNDPCKIADTSWIKPGKVLREVTLSTAGGKACVDFAEQHNLQYIEFDWKWYGPDGRPDSDPTRVGVDPDRPQGGLDLHEVIRYARQRGVGVLVYVDHRDLERHADKLFPLYHEWGLKGVKFGFVNVGPQRWTAWMHDAIKKAAHNQLMVDVHDEYRPTGWSRTYPNFMTMEGIRGDEEIQTNAQCLTTLFTRMIAGPADNTICYYDRRVDEQATHAYQLAKMVCFYSPLQFVFWYDRPFVSRRVTGRGPDAPNVLGNERELDFFARCPTVWDDTKVLDGRIGEYAIVARRSGDEWFIGFMNSGQPREFEVPLAFLAPDVAYAAHVYGDDPDVPTRTHVRIDRLDVDQGTKLKISASAQGGQAVRIIPRKD